MPTVSLRSASAKSVKADALVIGVNTSKDQLVAAAGAEAVAAIFKGFASTLKPLGVSGKIGDATKVPSNGAAKAPVLVVVGLGAAEEELSLESLRRAVGAAVRSLADTKTVAASLPASTDTEVRAIVEGALLGAYAYDRYLAKKHKPIGEIVVLTERARNKSTQSALATAETVVKAVNFARDLVNAPPNDLYPEVFATEAKKAGRGSKVTVTVSDEKTLAEKGFGGIMSVGQGSARPPRLVKLSYKPFEPVAHLAFVGKGITFDSGGLSIKPALGMGTMKCDMSGAAAVVAATYAIAELGLPVRITAYACLAENMPSGSATRPGDVVTMYAARPSRSSTPTRRVASSSPTASSSPQPTSRTC